MHKIRKVLLIFVCVKCKIECLFYTLQKIKPMKHYLFFCTHSYAVPILRPLEKAIKSRGGDVAWYLEKSCPVSVLNDSDRRLDSLKEVRAWNPLAVFAPGIYIYDFFPGVKVEVFHGYPIYKRGGTEETHFRIRGWFDIYLSSGPSSTPIFKELEKKDGSFRVYETGWAKADAMVNARQEVEAEQSQAGIGTQKSRPTVFVATTFTDYVTQLRNLFPTIKRLSETRDWNWVITMHPKLEDAELRADIKRLADERDNVTYYPEPPAPEVLARTDVMLCDSSSIILEYMMLEKPVVTLRNTTPGPHLIDVQEPEEVEAALEKAMLRPQELMDEIHRYLDFHEAHRDGQNCERILDAVDDFVANHQSHLKRKPLNLFRKLKIRWKFFVSNN